MCYGIAFPVALQVSDVFQMCSFILISVAVSDTAAGDQPGLVVRKLQQCCVMFNFDDPLADVKSKEVKRACLNELIAALNDTRGLLTEAVCIELVHMVSRLVYLNVQ